ncbi:uncharacterized protein FFUJ_03832 [Fusarium fujikuroi IMI 58289]|uniref:Uncharacterized protein n=1 Tax=Gibberella fujikuroi (strain CBS 195.34 / IMI 58289 / NRRL A-6831) TaxID=1279085 RepID=S0DR34_GIBF5|nr:uncharacterized protein FFUJ_03832 [Fusarium fujikuroi IMI 58289]CCT64906.1 uncharacterized protein FFUJ_03832 [Fusarium fujikuroi IMI 58289]SCN90000.1 uncharacterized protein FFM5_04849 [Fusarium fujikuroi]SCO36250.1 uncharacterized protein FFMR_04002 [Fusarium fujikuroi]
MSNFSATLSLRCSGDPIERHSAIRPQACDALVAEHSCNGHFNNLTSCIQEARFLIRILCDAALDRQSLEARQKLLYCNEHHRSKGNTADERRRSISPAFIE